jgi:hypothetical protein
MTKKSDSKWLSLATASILGQPPRGAYFWLSWTLFFPLQIRFLRGYSFLGITLIHQFFQNRAQDAAIQIILNFYRRIDAASGLKSCDGSPSGAVAETLTSCLMKA